VSDALLAEVPSLANEQQRRRHSLRHGYVPPRSLIVDPSLAFHTAVDADLDPVTYEVVRSKLWNLNLDHGDTIRRVSGSGIVVEGYDFNCAVTTEVGDAVALSPYSMFFAGFADEVIKWTLEHRSMNVGVRDGDVFLQDDPWVGANHQMDAAVYAPVFVDGRLFAWLYNCAHQRELGGAQPGGFIQDATDVWTEASFTPPVKLAEGGVMREDVVDMWTRRSRLPALMALELNSQVAGLRVARQRLLALVERYGAATVKAAMEKMIADTARAVARRLARRPDATWRDERWVAGVNRGEVVTFRMCLSFHKVGDRLLVTNDGTDPAVGAFNSSPGVLRAAVLNGLLPTLAFDQQLCGAGVLRQVDFAFTPGTVTAASHPSAVSMSLASVATVNQAQVLAAKMASGDEELAGHAFASSSLHTISNNGVTWAGPGGHRIGDNFLDMLAGGIGAFDHRDGIDFAGGPLAVAHHFSDVEKFEQAIPFLYLYRRELPHSGGHGRFRGGATLAAAWVGHKDDTVQVSSSGFVKSVTMGVGLCGGYPATGGYHWHATDTPVRDWFAAGRMPAGPADLRELAPGAFAPVRPDNRLRPTDVFELVPNPGAGWGDPLEREPRLVTADLANGRLRPDEATAIYGAVLRDDGTGALDADATAARRQEVRAQRRRDARPPRRPGDGTTADVAGAGRAIEGVAVVDGRAGAGPRFACAACGCDLGDARESYRLGCCELDLALADISELFPPPEDETGQVFVLRGAVCPGCGRLLDAHVCRPDDVPYRDVSLAVPSGGSA
jgi:N-methylhydantoinase B